MDKVVANGIYQGKQLSVEADFADTGFSLLFNGERDFWLEGIVLDEMSKNHPLGGTYYPETKKLNLVVVLEGYFFDYSPDIEIWGDIEEAPHKKGCVY